MHTLAVVSSLANASQFTGIEQTRVVDLLTLLALISFAMWTITAISIIARIIAKLIIHHMQKKTLPGKEPQTV